MSKQIKVSDEIYDRLKATADDNYRSLGGQIEYLMDKDMGVHAVLGQKVAFAAPPEKDLLKNTPPEKNPTPKSRDKGDILADIRDKERERDEELRYCQDHDESDRITRTYGVQIQTLWDEYNEETS